MKPSCPTTAIYKKLQAKFAAGMALLEEKKPAQCAMSCFAGRMKEKIFQRLAQDDQYRDEISRGLTQELSVLFVDIRGFSSRTSSMPPDRIIKLLDLFIPEMLDIIIERHKGTVDKLLGDGIMALYGHPYRTGEEIIQALYSAVDMQQVAAAMAHVLDLIEHEPIEIGVGVNRGEVLICEVGNEKYREVTAIGAPVNLAAKMEDVAEANQIAVPENVLAAVEKLRPKMLKYFERQGHQHGVDVFTLDWAHYIEDHQKEVAGWEIK